MKPPPAPSSRQTSTTSGVVSTIIAMKGIHVESARSEIVMPTYEGSMPRTASSAYMKHMRWTEYMTIALLT